MTDKTYYENDVLLSYTLPITNSYQEIWYNLDGTDYFFWENSSNSNRFGCDGSLFLQYMAGLPTNSHTFVKYWPFGKQDDQIVLIDISDMKSGSGFDLTFNFSVKEYYVDQTLGPDYVDFGLVFQACFYDQNFNEIGISQATERIVNNADIEKTVSFTVPENAAYVLPRFTTDYLDFAVSITYELSDILMSCKLSAFEDNSETMNNILDQLQSNQEEEKKQTGWLEGIWSGISELPGKIINGLIDGLKGLFIPSENDILDMKSRWESLLSDRFGAVYDSISIIDDWANAFSFSGSTYGSNTEIIEKEEGGYIQDDSGGKVYIPEIKLNLAGADFAFGGWAVQIIPDGFEGLVVVLKMIVNVSCTLMFVNAMRHRLEAILR